MKSATTKPATPIAPARQRALEEQRKELAERGVTKHQEKAGRNFLSKRLFDLILPWGYEQNGTPFEMAKNFVTADRSREIGHSKRDDAWATYLGLPQRDGTFEISGDVPEGKSLAPDAEVLRFSNADHTEELFVNEELRRLRAANASAPRLDGPNRRAVQSGRYVANESSIGVMGHFTATRGQDERGPYVSYYDVWDLDPPVAGVAIPAELIAGHPMTIYGRVHFDPTTANRVIELEDEILAKAIKAAGAPASEEDIKLVLARNPGPIIQNHDDCEQLGVRELWVGGMLAALPKAFASGLPESLRGPAEALARLDPRYPAPQLSPEAPMPGLKTEVRWAEQYIHGPLVSYAAASIWD